MLPNSDHIDDGEDAAGERAARNAHTARDWRLGTTPTDELESLRTRLAEAEAESKHLRACREQADAAAMGLAEANRTLARERDEARKIVEAMPRTADGKPIVFGMTVYHADPDGGSFAPILETQVTGIYAKNFAEYIGEATVGFANDYEAGNGECFSTRSAAESAKAKEAKRE